jgi:hypothetical protein
MRPSLELPVGPQLRVPMNQTNSELASWASILGTLATILGLIQSVSWLTAIGVACIGIAVFALIHAKNRHRLLRSATVNIGGRNLDILNIANLRRRLNRSLIVQRACHLAAIEGRDLTVSWQYDGYCSAEKETSIEFSIDAENNIPFSDLECYAFDRQQDPECLHRIRPILIGGDGLSKKVAVPFLKPLVAKQPFSVLLHCKLPGCIGSGVQHYTSTLSFDQRSIPKLAVQLAFIGKHPDWVRVYECGNDGMATLVKDLPPTSDDGDVSEWIDIVENVPGQSTRIYAFHISPAERRTDGFVALSGQKLIRDS